MSNKDTGGPAFPTPKKITSNAIVDQTIHTLGGMDLRDYFAAKALEGILAGWASGLPPSSIATEAAYAYADDMLKARKQ